MYDFENNSASDMVTGECRWISLQCVLIKKKKKYTFIMLVYCFLGRPVGGCSTPIYKAEDLGSNSCLTTA